jgi:NADH-quinone oxidoreductase subunit M
MDFFFPLLFLALLPFPLLLAVPAHRLRVLRPLALWCSLPPFFWSLGGAFLFDPVSSLKGGWVEVASLGWLSSFQMPYVLALDGVSLAFIVLSTFLTPICILASWESIRYRQRTFLLLLFATQLCLIHAFGARDLLLFYLSFEAVVIPVFIIIGLWGSRLRRIGAAFRFFLYTIVGSLLMLVALVYLYLTTGSLHLSVLDGVSLDPTREFLLWFALFASFATKIPMVPLHVWLPEAHVEAPTAGSVLLAGILLKLGGYGFFRFSLPLFPQASCRLAPLVFMLSLLAILYSSLATLVQVDLKKAIAYSSVAHMNYATLGLFSGTSEGLGGALVLMVSHGLVSSGLFLAVGFLYDRYGSRLLRYYGGLAQLMPVYAGLLLVLFLANLSLPGTLSFVPEFLVLLGAFGANTFVALGATFGVIFSAAYSIWLYNRLCFGPVSSALSAYSDLNGRELSLLVPLVVLVLVFGVFPAPLLAPFQFPLSLLLLDAHGSVSLGFAFVATRFFSIGCSAGTFGVGSSHQSAW